MLALPNKVAIVTGASSGIGYATAKLFAREEAKIVVAARRQASPQIRRCLLTAVSPSIEPDYTQPICPWKT